MAAQLVTKREGLTGGATGVSGDVDGISATDRGDGNALQEGDLCDVVVSGNVFNYKYSSGTADVENSPYLIKPDTGAASGYAWILQNKIAGLDTSTTVADADKIEVLKDSTGLSVNMARSDFMKHDIAYHDDTTATGAELNTLTDGSIAGVLHDHARVVFPATAVPSSDPNTLDDYEEGSWTPTIGRATVDTVVSSYNTQAGWYTKIGNTVICHASIIINGSNITTQGSGPNFVSGLPYTVNNTNYSAIGIVGYNDLFSASNVAKALGVTGSAMLNFINDVRGQGDVSENWNTGAGSKYLGIFITYTTHS